jgi:peptidoglycan lytic transglycosylase
MHKPLLLALGAAFVACGSAQAAQGTQQGQASYFNGGQSGHTETASGTPVDPRANTAASRTLPLGSKATVTNQNNGKSTPVTITDRGPTRTDRVVDVSKAAAQQLGMEKSGTAPVKVTPDTNGK